MGAIDLADVKVSYEGQTLPAINLISKLQMQLHEAASQLAAVTEALGDLQAALLNSHTVEVKLTLSKEDYGRFSSLGGKDDSERIRKAVMSVIHPEEPVHSPGPIECRPAAEMLGAPLPVESTAEELENIHLNAREPRPVEPLLPPPHEASEIPMKKKATTKCPRCQALIDLPEELNDQWPVEVKCNSCGAKCLVKSKSLSGGKIDKTGLKSGEDAAHGKLYGVLST